MNFSIRGVLGGNLTYLNMLKLMVVVVRLLLNTNS